MLIRPVLAPTVQQMSAAIRIGISGWRYKPWRGVFYPSGLPQRAELQFASRMFGGIEINGSFYSLQTPTCYQRWYDDTPGDFIFTVKGSRYISHMRRLIDVRVPLANFFASGLFNLREKLGPILWQFPASFKFDAARIEPFLQLLPKDTEQALKLARSRDERLKGRARLAIDENRTLRYAMEIRHDSFRDEAFIRLLREYNVALVVADTARRWPFLEEVTADFMYLRLHGEEELYRSGYTDTSLDRWAERIKAWTRGSQPKDAARVSTKRPPRASSRDIYCFFDNDAKVHAPFDAQKLMQRLGLQKEQNSDPRVRGVSAQHPRVSAAQ
jgi:uncharacterized protein YecE (DUF72 family)